MGARGARVSLWYGKAEERRRPPQGQRQYLQRGWSVGHPRL